MVENFDLDYHHVSEVSEVAEAPQVAGRGFLTPRGGHADPDTVDCPEHGYGIPRPIPDKAGSPQDDPKLVILQTVQIRLAVPDTATEHPMQALSSLTTKLTCSPMFSETKHF